MSLVTVEVSITVIVSILALVISAYSITIAKKRGENTDIKELSGILATLSTKLDTIEKAVLGNPTLNEQVAVNTQKIREHDRRITALEQR